MVVGHLSSFPTIQGGHVARSRSGGRTTASPMGIRVSMASARHGDNTVALRTAVLIDDGARRQRATDRESGEVIEVRDEQVRVAVEVKVGDGRSRGAPTPEHAIDQHAPGSTVEDQDVGVGLRTRKLEAAWRDVGDRAEDHFVQPVAVEIRGER